MDTGNNVAGGRKATQVDEGWRNNNQVNTRKATEVDEGWRAETVSSGRKATEVDEGWRAEAVSSGRKATEVDEGWRAETASSGRKATVVDEGWRKAVADVLDPASIMQATENHFSTIDEFKKEVAKLPQLVSSTNNVYTVKKTVSAAGGESIVLLCSAPDGNDVVAKVYYEPANGKGTSISTRTHILEYMGTEEGKKYTLAVSEIGLVEFGESKYYFEIMPYCPNTDLSDDGAYSFDDIVKITKQVNEALHSIHQAGIIHRDIKPENLYELDGQIKLGDFGIARNGAVGRSKATEYIAGTEGYAAPETRRYIFSEKSDYYSLGVTLATLFEGHFVFDNMTFEMQSLAQESERLPLTRVDKHREQLENLFNGLCRINSKHRFGYEDVNRWLADHNYTGGVLDEEWPKSIRMCGEVYRDEKSLFYGITKDDEHWNEALELLYGKSFEEFFRSFRTDLSRSAQKADELYRADDKDKGLAVFLKDLFAPGPIVWRGYTYNSLEELANKMVVAKSPAAFGEILQKHCISHWLAHTVGIKVDEKSKKLVDEIEELSISAPEIACYWFGNAFISNKRLNICEQEVATIQQLIDAMFSDPNAFYQGDGFKKLINQKDGADLYGFLFSLGYRELVEKEWVHLKQCDLFNKTCILLSMMDNVATKAGVDASGIRSFFVNYGPIGIATYTKKLLTQNDSVYTPLDSDGKQAIAKITSFREPTSGTVDELFRGYTPLVESVDKLRRILLDNPFCIVTGVYENRGVMCTNIKGCFAFNIFERVAPLGFSALIETANGGTK